MKLTRRRQGELIPLALASGTSGLHRLAELCNRDGAGMPEPPQPAGPAPDTGTSEGQQGRQRQADSSIDRYRATECLERQAQRDAEAAKRFRPAGRQWVYERI